MSRYLCLIGSFFVKGSGYSLLNFIHLKQKIEDVSWILTESNESKSTVGSVHNSHFEIEKNSCRYRYFFTGCSQFKCDRASPDEDVHTC